MPLRCTRLACPACEMQLEGTFNLPPLLRLSAEDRSFVMEFILASGSLKEMSKIRKQSYPTIRNRLNDIIALLQPTTQNPDQLRHEILDAVAKGEMDPTEGARLLKEIKG